MSKINEEIKEMADKMVKSTTDSKQLLFDAIMELGPEGIKKALPTLSDENKAVLKSFLEDFEKSKAVSMDDEYTPERTATEAEDLETEAQTGSDEEDEDLVKEKAKEHKHQGDNSPEGYEGQVIKAEKREQQSKKKLADAVDEIAEDEAKEAVQEHNDKLHEGQEVSKGRGPDKKPRKRRGEGGQDPDALDYSTRGVSDSAISDPGQSVRGMKVRDAKEAKQSKDKRERDWGEKISTQAKEDASRKLKELKDMPKPNLTKAVPEGVDKEKYESCVRQVKQEGKVDSPWAICAESLKKMGYGKEEVKKMMYKMGDKVNKGKVKEEVMKEDEESVEKADSLIQTRKQQETKMDKVESGKKDQLLEEEEQTKTTDQTKGKKEEIPEEDGELNVQSQETADEALSQLKKDGMKKSEEESSEEDLEKAKSVKHYVDKIMSDKLQVQDVLKEAPDEMRDDILAALREKKGMNKSIEWNPKNPLAAGSLGRNTHWDVDEYIVKSHEETQEKIEKGAMYLNEESGDEELQKSESEEEKQEDLNDLIEKSMDTTWGDLEHRKQMEANAKAQNGQLTKSFEDDEMAAAMGLSEEEAKKILGE